MVGKTCPSELADTEKLNGVKFLDEVSRKRYQWINPLSIPPFSLPYFFIIILFLFGCRQTALVHRRRRAPTQMGTCNINSPRGDG